MDQESAATAARLMADLGSVTSNLKSILKLISGRVMLIPECKRMINQILHSILSEKGTDTSVLLTILDMIKDWIENDFRPSASGTSNLVLNQDIILYLQRLSQVDRQNLSPAFLEEWDGKYLQLLYRLCSDSSKYPMAVRQEVFQKVERQYMLGLRAKDPETRQKFFALYHESLGKTLFIWLQYIIQTQEWEALSDVFWLKQGLDLLLAILVEHEPITLAPNSAQVPPLMASGAFPECAGMQQQIGDSPEDPDGAPLTFIGLVNKHAKFLNEISKLQVEDDLMYSTFGEVYEINCARYGREADLPITHFKERLNQAIAGQLSSEAIADLRLHTYNEITSSLVSENVFSQYMYKTLPSCNHLWAFKKQFAVQLALSGFMSYMLQIGGRSPNKILFAKNTGKVFQNDFHPAYDTNGMIEFNEPVPFRLTRNLQTFFTPFGVGGLFVSAMCAAAQSIVAPKSQHMQHQLAMFFRDELLSWSWRRPPGMPTAPAAAGGISPVEFEKKVTTNVEHVIGRIKGIAPQCFPEEDENATEPPQSIQRGVTDLVDAALRPKSLCMMDPTWHPWF